MQGTEVLVVISTSTYYGEDMTEIDRLERAVREVLKKHESVRVTFFITQDVRLDKVGKIDYIAFLNTDKSKMFEARRRGMKVLRLNHTTQKFEEVIVEKDDKGFRVIKI